jgi:hypothetical protein
MSYPVQPEVGAIVDDALGDGVDDALGDGVGLPRSSGGVGLAEGLADADALGVGEG